ncbi:hypothetical protein Tco_0093716 [Tanacetum coccineum]
MLTVRSFNNKPKNRKNLQTLDVQISKEGYETNRRRIRVIRQVFRDIRVLRSTCELETEVNDEDGKLYFRRFPIAWAVIKVENNQNWCWFLSLIRDDLNLGDGGGISIISDRHKESVADWLPNAEHKQCARYIYANFKKRWSGLHFKRLFGVLLQHQWSQSFCKKIEEIKMLDDKAHEWLVERNPNSWYGCSTAFKNGISESFNSRIVRARGKPIITMLEDIRVYIMQRIFCMNKLAFDNKDSITPSVRRQMEYNKRIQRSKGIVFQEALSSSMPPSTATPSILKTMPPPPTPSTSNTMLLPPTPSTSNTMPPPSGSNTMPPPPTPSGSNTTPGSNTSVGSNTMPSYAASASTRTNKGKCPLIPKKRGKPAKSSTSSSRGGSKGGARVGASKRGRGSSKRGRGSNTIPFQGLRDEASDEEHQFKMDMEAVFEMKREQMGMLEDVVVGKQPMTEDVSAGKQPMIEDDPLPGGADLPTQESTVEANPNILDPSNPRQLKFQIR